MSKSLPSRAMFQLRRTSKKLLSFCAHSLFGSKSYEFFGIPKGLAEAESCKREIEPFYVMLREPPCMLQDWNTVSSHFNLSEDVPAGEVLELSHAIGTATGGNLNEKRELVTTFLRPIDGKKNHEHDLFYFSSKRFSPKIFSTQEPVATLAEGWQDAFYHWCFDILCKIHLLRKGNFPFHYLFVEAKTAFQKESLKHLGFSEERIIDCAVYDAVKTPKLFAPRLPGVPALPPKWACQFLRENFLPLAAHSHQRKKRIYISRCDAPKRKIINEDEVVAGLERFGFQKVLLSQLPFLEQVRLFAEAEMVVAPHGAGLTHLVYCDTHTPVLEIFSPGHISTCFWGVAQSCALHYHCLIGEKSAQGPDPDILVDFKKLLKMIELMELKKRSLVSSRSPSICGNTDN